MKSLREIANKSVLSEVQLKKIESIILGHGNYTQETVREEIDLFCTGLCMNDYYFQTTPINTIASHIEALKAAEIMACDVPLIAARVGSMAGLFKDHPEWLFTPDSNRDLAVALEHRLVHQKTDYSDVSSWQKAATILEKIMVNLTSESHL